MKTIEKSKSESTHVRTSTAPESRTCPGRPALLDKSVAILVQVYFAQACCSVAIFISTVASKCCDGSSYGASGGVAHVGGCPGSAAAKGWLSTVWFSTAARGAHGGP